MKDINHQLLEKAALDNVFRYNVAAVFINNKQEVFLCQRATSKKFKPNLRHLPGGKVENGELPSLALQREIEEELGIFCKIISYTGVQYDHFDEEGNKHRTSFFFCQGEGNITLDFETQDTGWFNKDKLATTFLQINKDSAEFYDCCIQAIDFSLLDIQNHGSHLSNNN